MRNKVLKKLDNAVGKGVALSAISAKSGIPYGSMWRLFHNRSGSINNIEKLEMYFKRAARKR